MTDDRFEELMRDAAHTYRKPPQAELDAMWREIETAQLGEGKHRSDAAARDDYADHATEITRVRKFSIPRWAAIAATLVVGVGIGRLSMSTSIGRSAAPAHVETTLASVEGANTVEKADSIAGAPYVNETSKYLGQTAALLIALPSEARAGHADEQFATRANELLGRTRLLIDSPAANDPQMRTLLEDLELVLAQIVRLQNNHSRTELDIINHALEQRDVIPRLRTAVADISAN
jgi:hypothetical protein